ncbi:hypothetical protein J6590_047756 [Homalodisca vitripennis]|nr:hypothetical protein J6590_047756 [Homalodisca vitripennis]
MSAQLPAAADTFMDDIKLFNIQTIKKIGLRRKYKMLSLFRLRRAPLLEVSVNSQVQDANFQLPTSLRPALRQVPASYCGMVAGSASLLIATATMPLTLAIVIPSSGRYLPVTVAWSLEAARYWPPCHSPSPSSYLVASDTCQLLWHGRWERLALDRYCYHATHPQPRHTL